MSDKLVKDGIALEKGSDDRAKAIEEKLNKEAIALAEKEAKEAEKAREKAEKEAKEAEEKAREKAEKEAKEEEKAREKAEKEAKEAAEEARKKAEKEAKEKSENSEEKKHRYDYFFRQFDAFKKDRTEEIERNYKTSYDVIAGVTRAKRALINSERFFTKLAEYKSARLEYEINITKYQFGHSDNDIRRIEIQKEILRRVYNIRVRALKARLSEYFDNRRYLRAINLTSERKTLRTIARPAIIDRNKVTLLALLERRSEINDELMKLYAERSADYLNAENKNNEFSVRLRARRRAFNKLYDAERKAEQYLFTAEESAKIYARMNALVEMEADVKVLKYREKHAPEDQKHIHRDAIDAKKKEMEKIEDAMDALLDKGKNRAQIDDKRNVWKWVAGITLGTLALIALFIIFNEPITEFIMNWAWESR